MGSISRDALLSFRGQAVLDWSQGGHSHLILVGISSQDEAATATSQLHGVAGGEDTKGPLRSSYFPHVHEAPGPLGHYPQGSSEPPHPSPWWRQSSPEPFQAMLAPEG